MFKKLGNRFHAVPMVVAPMDQGIQRDLLLNWIAGDLSPECFVSSDVVKNLSLESELVTGKLSGTVRAAVLLQTLFCF